MLFFFMSGLTELVSWPKLAQQMLCNFSDMFQILHMKLPVHQLPARLKGKKEGKGCQLSFEKYGVSRRSNFRVLFQKSTNPCLPLSSLSLDMGSESSPYFYFSFASSLYISPPAPIYHLYFHCFSKSFIPDLC